MEHDRRPEFEEIFQAAIHGNLWIYYGFIARELGRFAGGSLVSAGIQLPDKIAKEITA